jgi:surface polysaccharide O-acyltransferase-like enzyme
MRINRIDSFRTAAILAVICIHTKPFLVPDSSSLPYKLIGILINQGGRFAVPFFLIISGYLFGCKLTQGVDPFELGKRYSSRILPIFFFWDLVYLLSPAITDDVLKYGVLRPIYWNARNLIRSPLDLVFQGTKFHLWFMVSLLTTWPTLGRFRMSSANSHRAVTTASWRDALVRLPRLFITSPGASELECSPWASQPRGSNGTRS